MKTKKTILTMVLSMILSIGVLCGISAEKNCKQCVSWGCGYMAAASETSGKTATWGMLSAGAFTVMCKGASATIACGWCPLGWAAGAVTVIAGA